jgi:signal transduction histidine kinase
LLTIGDHGTIEFRVQDNGCGISLQDQSQLFQLFGKLEKTQEINAKGIGLGLYICKKISQAFGGNTSVESALGKGSTFIFNFMLEEKLQDHRTVDRYLNP